LSFFSRSFAYIQGVGWKWVFAGHINKCGASPANAGSWKQKLNSAEEKMSTTLNEDVVGYRVEGNDVCTECAKDDDTKNLTHNMVITKEEIEKGDGNLLFCDRCQKEITA
jgi:hypothetical protein